MNHHSSLKLSLVKTTLVGLAAFVFTCVAQALDLSPPQLRSESIAVSMIDIVHPTNHISSPTNGMTVSNASYTVTGTARDNVGVTNVFISLNGGAWLPVLSSNNFTNWTASFTTLTPGTNIVQAFAVDGSGNYSATNTVKFVYVVSGVLEVSVSGGRCIITPNYNNATLRIGKAYSMTASNAPGFKFLNWSNSLTSAVSTNPILHFTMESNLVLTASVLDIVKPTNTIIKPTANLNVSNASYTIVGSAHDNLGVANVSLWLNGVSTPVISSNGFTNWSASVTLSPGTNTIQAFASDAAGNHSATNKVIMVYVLTAPISVTTSGGKGSITPNYNGKSLVLGRAYSMTASNAPGFEFVDWTDGTDSVVSTNPTLHFTMASNLAYTANFQDSARPSVTITSPTNHQIAHTAGVFVSGQAADNVAVTNVYFTVSGGVIWTSAQTTNNWTNWTAFAPLTLGTNIIQAYSVDGSGLNSAVASVAVVVVPARTNFSIPTSAGMDHPQAQIAFDGGNYLVAYQTHPNGPTNSPDNMGQFVSPTGQLVGSPADSGVSGDAPCLAFDGANYFMTAVTFTGSGDYIQGVFIATNGTVGIPTQVSQSTTVENFGTMVYGAGAYFLEWSDSVSSGNNGGFDDIYGALIAPDGTTIASDFRIATLGNLNEAGQGSAAFDGTNFLATWGGASGHMSIGGRIISPTGDFVTDPFVIYTNSSIPNGVSLSAAAFDGTKYLVLFNAGLGSGAATNWHILGRFVTPAGEVLTNHITITTDAGPQIVPCVTFDGTEYLVTWNQGFNPAAAAGATTGSVKARFFDTDGNPITPEFTVFSPSAVGQTALWGTPLFDGLKFFLVGGLGKQLTGSKDLKFTDGILQGSFLYLTGPEQQQTNSGSGPPPPILPVIHVGTNSPPPQGPTAWPATYPPPILGPEN